ncbi:hypothetical protein ACH4E8_29370 [Streptomyces sp. NPDC017979]|uniref:hypothetical protein n=1 Tax=Streptomyces sp. NPDC017979 TaxID=3365024 RepID=UPI00378E9C3F
MDLDLAQLLNDTDGDRLALLTAGEAAAVIAILRAVADAPGTGEETAAAAGDLWERLARRLPST